MSSCRAGTSAPSARPRADRRRAALTRCGGARLSRIGHGPVARPSWHGLSMAAVPETLRRMHAPGSERHDLRGPDRRPAPAATAAASVAEQGRRGIAPPAARAELPPFAQQYPAPGVAFRSSSRCWSISPSATRCATTSASAFRRAGAWSSLPTTPGLARRAGAAQPGGSIRSDVKIVANGLFATLAPSSACCCRSRCWRTQRRAAAQGHPEHPARRGQSSSSGRRGLAPAPGGVRDGRWHSGFLRLAAQTQAPIVPIPSTAATRPCSMACPVLKPLAARCCWCRRCSASTARA